MQLPACAVCVLRLSWCGFAANGWWRWWWARQGLLCRDFLFELSPSSLCVSCRLSCFGIIDVVGVLFNVLCVRICACACVCVCVASVCFCMCACLCQILSLEDLCMCMCVFAAFRLRVAYQFSVWHMFFVPDILCVVSTCVVDHLRERERERARDNERERERESDITPHEHKRTRRVKQIENATRTCTCTHNIGERWREKDRTRWRIERERERRRNLKEFGEIMLINASVQVYSQI